MVWTIFVVLLVLWLLGPGLIFGGVLINLLLVVALAVLPIKVSGPRATVRGKVLRVQHREADAASW